MKEPPRPLPTLESIEVDPKDGREGWGRGERHGRRRRHRGELVPPTVSRGETERQFIPWTFALG